MPQDERPVAPVGTPTDQATNTVATTPTHPPTRAPIIGQGPVTEHPPLNMAMGAAVVGATQAGFATMTGGPEVLGTSIFLNLVAQLVKGFKWFPEHKGLIVVMFVLALLVSTVFLFGLDNLREAFLNASNSTMQALLNYKGDKAAGLNVMPPVPDTHEYGGEHEYSYDPEPSGSTTGDPRGIRTGEIPTDYSSRAPSNSQPARKPNTVAWRELSTRRARV